jgi:hypothetical protein
MLLSKFGQSLGLFESAYGPFAIFTTLSIRDVACVAGFWKFATTEERARIAFALHQDAFATY